MNGPPPEKFRDPSLVDFGTAAGGAARRLECLGGMLVDRPLLLPDMPARRLPAIWSQASACFHESGGWEFSSTPPDPWVIHVPLGAPREKTKIALEVRPAPSGQIGVFLEQVPQWQWLFSAIPRGSRVLSLFAHSGAATLAAAAAGADVVHVDASKQATALARRNAAASGLATAPIRWLCEDARGFVGREVRRSAAYDAVILDPPSWGHGPKGQAFSIDRDLVPLLADVARLLRSARAAGRPGLLLLTCHSPRWHQRRLRDTLAETFSLPRCDSGRLTCTDGAGRDLVLGDYARFAFS